jgi:hypothetical protein
VEFPSPFTEMMSALSVFSFDFLSFECFFPNSDYFLSVYLWATIPVALAIALVFVHAVRLATRGGNAAEVANRLLLLGFLSLPVVSLKLFQALDCVEVAERSYLRIDTSVVCDSQQYKSFALVDGLFIVIYMSMPLVWLALLQKNKGRLNPGSGTDKKHALFLRDSDQGLAHLRFLFAAYKPPFYFAECIEMWEDLFIIWLLFCCHERV